MRARIYKPAKTAMSSGTAKTKYWVLEHVAEASREVDPLMGWTSSNDTQAQVKLEFDSKEAALDYAKEHDMVIARHIINFNDKPLNDYAFMQTCNLKHGLKKFGDKGSQTALKSGQATLKRIFQANKCKYIDYRAKEEDFTVSNLCDREKR